jgi:hypothetical protein
MRTRHSLVLLAALLSLSPQSGSTSPRRPLSPFSAPAALPASVPAAAPEEAVRAFMRTVAHDVSEEGPAAWQKFLADEPAFFLASEGLLVFPNGAAAKAAIPELVRTIKHIELTWGDDLRVDPLTAEFAVVGASYHEVRVDPKGQHVDEKGFFTGTAEYRDGRWQFRNTHWSVIAPPAPPRVP